MLQVGPPNKPADSHPPKADIFDWGEASGLVSKSKAGFGE